MRTGAGYVEFVGKLWYLRIPVTDTFGRKKQRRVPLGPFKEIRSKEAARRIADEWLARQSPSTLKPGLQVRFVEFAEWYLELHVAGLRPSSRRRYRSAVRSLQRQLDRELVCNIDAARLKLALNALAEHQANSSVCFTRTIALAMLRLARDKGFGAHIVNAREVPMPRNAAQERERHSFTREQLDMIFAASTGQWRTLWAVMAFAGLRVGEALALEWTDVDFTDKVIRVRRNLTRSGTGATKTVTSAASVPILPELEAFLVEHRGVEQRAGLVFINGRGRHLDADNLRKRRLRPFLASLGFPLGGMHTFRHSTPGLLMSLGLGTELVRRFMRHGSLAITERYTHSSDRDLRAAIDAAVKRRQ